MNNGQRAKERDAGEEFLGIANCIYCASDGIRTTVGVESIGVTVHVVPTDEEIAQFIWGKMDNEDFLFEECPDRLERPGELIDDMISIAAEVRKFICGGV